MGFIREYANVFLFTIIGILVAVVGYQYVENSHLEVQLAGANATIATNESAYDKAYAKQSEDNRKAENDIRADFALKDSAAQARIKTLQDSVAKLDASGVSLRSQLATYTAAARARSLASAVAGNSEATASALDLLSDLYGRADDRAGVLAKALDASYGAGKECEARYEVIQKSDPTVAAPGISASP